MEGNSVTVTKLGRKPILKSGAMTTAERQRRARNLAFSTFCASGDWSKISTSHLISFLPKLISDSHKKLVRMVCLEIIRREG